MSKILTCENCSIECYKVLYRKNIHYSTTQYEGVLCSNSCCISWITKKKIANMKEKKISKFEGTIKIVYTKNHATLKI
jgi:hypothetical protein